MRVYSYIKSTKVLGPYSRFVLWVQGCPFSCKFCMTPDSQSFEAGEELSLDFLLSEILSSDNIEGITLTGGEPFSKAKELVELLEDLKNRRDLGLIIYTGFTIKQLKDKKDFYTNKLLEFTDILIDGQYIESKNDGVSLRGSSNQNIYQLTNRYKYVFDKYYNKSIREVEIHINNDSTMLVGIPKSRNLLNIKNEV